MFGKKLKKLAVIGAIFGLILIILSPYLITFYVEYKYNKFCRNIEKLIPGIKINNYIERGYLNSLLMSEIKFFIDSLIVDYDTIDSDNLSDSGSNSNPRKIVILQNQILPFKQGLATIYTNVLTKIPQFIKNQKNFKVSTNINFKGVMSSAIKNIEIQYKSSEANAALKCNQIELLWLDDKKNLQLDVKLPKLVYRENFTKVEIENLHFNLKIREYADETKLRIKFLTEIEDLYLLNKSKQILKLSNLNIEQRLSDKLSHKITFLKLNILNHKFGPLATKLQFNNMNLPRVIENIIELDLKLPLNRTKLNQHTFIKFANALLKYKPNFSGDLLLYIGQKKMNLLSDFMIDSQHEDWLDLDDIIDSLSINIYVKIPKKVAVDLLASILELRQYKNYHNSSPLNLNELNDLSLEKIQYLLNHNIIKAEDNNFVINLTITEGTFYSKMNPFKIFTF